MYLYIYLSKYKEVINVKVYGLLMFYIFNYKFFVFVQFIEYILTK